MKLNNEIVDIVDNLILKGDGSVFALYEVEPEVMNPVAFTKKEQLKATVESWLSDIKPYGDFDITMLPRTCWGNFGSCLKSSQRTRRKWLFQSLKNPITI